MAQIKKSVVQGVFLLNKSGKHNFYPEQILKDLFRVSAYEFVDHCLTAKKYQSSLILEVSADVAESLVDRAEEVRMEKAENDPAYDDFLFYTLSSCFI